jgi:hypothetical protein
MLRPVLDKPELRDELLELIPEDVEVIHQFTQLACDEETALPPQRGLSRWRTSEGTSIAPRMRPTSFLMTSEDIQGSSARRLPFLIALPSECNPTARFRPRPS